MVSGAAQSSRCFRSASGSPTPRTQYSGLNVDSVAKSVRFTVTNTGKRAGTEIAEVYARLPQGAEESSYQRLAGWTPSRTGAGRIANGYRPYRFSRPEDIHPTNNRWNFAPGNYGVFVGGSSDSTPLTGDFVVP